MEKKRGNKGDCGVSSRGKRGVKEKKKKEKKKEEGHQGALSSVGGGRDKRQIKTKRGKTTMEG